MHHKNVLLVAHTKRCVISMQDLKQALDVSILSSTPDTLNRAFASGHEFDLIVIDTLDLDTHTIKNIESDAVDRGVSALLLVQDQRSLDKLYVPKHINFDFILPTASSSEFQIRCALLLWSGEDIEPTDEVSVDNMSINLATYQVCIDDRPVDLTLMEYSLLSFLATHPGRAYSREKLLHQVWGFEYCGGTRTVDVHIRRVRSKVGPQIASHIATVRGVGYLFKS